MDVLRFIIFNILTLSLPLIFCLLSRASFITTTTPPSPPSSSALSAAQVLREQGYSLFASALISTSTTNINLSGTILAPPDFAFSFATAKFSPQPFRRAPPRPSAALLQFHTLQTPSLKWFNLTNSFPDGDELQTEYNDCCLFLFKKANGDLTLSASKKSIYSVTIRQLDLYSDDTISVHGVDGVLDPTAAKKCSFSSKNNTTVGIQFPAERSFLDHAIRVLRTRGFHVVATAMALRRSDLLTLKAVTLFAPSDTALFSVPGGFYYDFRQHIIPKLIRFTDIMTFSDGTEFETLAPDKTVFIRSGAEYITVNGVRIDGGELYHNRWIVVYPISMTLNDTLVEHPYEFPESHFPDNEEMGDGVPSSAPATTSETIGEQSSSRERDISGAVVLGVPAVAPMTDQGQNITGESIYFGPPSLAPETILPVEATGEVPRTTTTKEQTGPRFPSPEVGNELAPGPPALAPISGEALLSIFAIDEVTHRHCRKGSPHNVGPGFTFEIEAGDPFCPASNAGDL